MQWWKVKGYWVKWNVEQREGEISLDLDADPAGDKVIAVHSAEDLAALIAVLELHGVRYYSDGSLRTIKQ